MQNFDGKKVALVSVFGLSSVFLIASLWNKFLNTSSLYYYDTFYSFFLFSPYFIPFLVLFVISGLLLLDYLNVNNRFSSVNYFNILLWIAFVVSGYGLLSSLVFMANPYATDTFYGALPLGDFFSLFFIPTAIAFLVSSMMLLSKLLKKSFKSLTSIIFVISYLAIFYSVMISGYNGLANAYPMNLVVFTWGILGVVFSFYFNR